MALSAPQSELPPLRMKLANDEAQFTVSPQSIHQVFYRVEQSRGYSYEGELWSPGFFVVDMQERDLAAIERRNNIQAGIDQDLGLIANGAHELIPADVAAGFLGAERTLQHHLVTPGVVARQLVDLLVAHQVDAAVAHVGNVQPAIVHGCHSSRGTHILLVALALGFQVDLGVGELQGGLQEQGDIFFLCGFGVGKDFFDGHFGGAFAGIFPTDAIGDNRQVEDQPGGGGDAAGLQAVFVKAPG